MIAINPNDLYRFLLIVVFVVGFLLGGTFVGVDYKKRPLPPRPPKK